MSKSDVGAYSYTGDQGTNYANPNTVTQIASTTYTYDNNGNLTNDGTWTYTWDYNNRLIRSANGKPITTYAYDHNGDRLTKILMV